MDYLGEVALGDTVTLRFNTADQSGAPITLAGTPSARVRKGTGSGSTITAGVSLTVDVVTGQHCVDVDTSASGSYTTGADYVIELVAGTVDGVSVAGRVLAGFSIGLRTLTSVDALPSAERDAIAAAVLDLADAIESGLTPRQAVRLMAAALAGKLSGAATTTIAIRNAVADSKDRITSTVDADGNRTAISVDLN